MSVETAIEKLIVDLRDTPHSAKAIAASARVAHSCVYDLLRGDNLRVDTLLKIERGYFKLANASS